MRAAFAALASLLALTGSTAAAKPLHDAGGLHVTAQRKLDARLEELAVTTSALKTPANIQILLPAGYAKHPHKRYPVLYLLHGTSGGAADWTKLGKAEQSTAQSPLIVVMPDIAINDDGGGWCTNWWNNGARGRPEWETFHVDQLIPFVDRNLRTIAGRKGREIAGLSQGGFCSTSYPARHPDLFIGALSYSGAPDIAYDAEAQTLVTPIINATETGLDHVPPNSMFGPRSSEEINWAGHDPATLANNLRGMKIYLFTGNGQRGPYDSTAPNPGAEGIEWGVHQLTILFHNHLDALQIPSFLDDYGPGTHSWPYWARDLAQSVPHIMADFAHPPATPKRITYTSTSPSYKVFNWTVITHRLVTEFSTLQNAGRTGFTLLGSGAATVTTPPSYKPRRRYRITVRSHAGTTTRVVRAGHNHRLTMSLPLGPSDTVQEYSLDGTSAGTTVYTTSVTIARAHK